MRTRTRLAAIGITTIIGTAPVGATAAWLSGGVGDGSATASTINRPAAPSVESDGATMKVSWSATTLANGDPVAGYRVYRHVSGASPALVCSTSALTCDDTVPDAGSYAYGVVAYIGNWSSPESELAGTAYEPPPPADLEAPAKPNTPDLVVDDDTGVSDSDNLTSQVTVTMTGTAEPGSTVRILRETVALGSGTATETGAYSIEVELSEGANALRATATDGANNTSAASDPVIVTLDTVVPAAPTISTVSADTGSSSTDLITKTAAQTVSGSTEPGTMVRLVNGTATVGGVTATSGNWTMTGVTLLEGRHGAIAVDRAGNESASQSTAQVLLDTVLPSVSINRPAQGVTYNSTSWSGSGCVPSPGLCGTADDTGSGLWKLSYELRDSAGKCWGGTSSFSASNCLTRREPLLPAGTWHEPATHNNLKPTGGATSASYTLRMRVLDVAGNESAEVVRNFVIQ